MTSSVAELVGQAESLGAAFELKDGGTGVKVRAKQPLPKEMMSGLKSRKAEIIEYLKRRDEPTPPAPTPADQTDQRMADFQRLREEATEEEIVPPSKPDSPVVIDQPGGPADESDAEADRRDAFAQARQQAQDDDVPEVKEAGDVDRSEWHDAFQKLSAKNEGAAPEAAEPPQTTEMPLDPGTAEAPEAGVVETDDAEFKAAFGALAEQFSGTGETAEPEPKADTPAPQQPAQQPSTPASSPESEARAADFASMREQAQAEEPAAPPPAPAPSASPPPAPPTPSEETSPEQASRFAEFESLRQQAQAEAPMPPPPSSDPPASPSPSIALADRRATKPLRR